MKICICCSLSFSDEVKRITKELEEENRKNNEQMQKANAQVKADIDLLKTAIPYMAGGMNELVRNGIAESVYDLLKKGEVDEESKEI